MRTIVWGGLPVLFAACASTSWQPQPGDELVGWHELRLFRGEHALVLASTEGAAAEAHGLARRAREAVLAESGVWPSRGLLIAWSADDALPFDDPDEHLAAAQRWQAAATGSRDPGRAPGLRPDAPVDRALIAKLATIAVPPRDAELALPPALAAEVEHAVMLPSDSCIRAVCSAMLASAVAQQDVGWLQRQALYAFSDPVDMLQERIVPQIHGQLIAAWASCGAIEPRHQAAVCERLGLPTPRRDVVVAMADQDAVGARALGPADLMPAESARALLAGLTAFAALDDPSIGVAATPTVHELFAMRSTDWGLVVDLEPVARRDAEVLDRGPRYAWMPADEYLPGRRLAERLEELRTAHPGFALVVADDPERAAALVAAHAFWVRGLPADEAVAIARRLGLGPRADALAAALRERFVR